MILPSQVDANIMEEVSDVENLNLKKKLIIKSVHCWQSLHCSYSSFSLSLIFSGSLPSFCFHGNEKMMFSVGISSTRDIVCLPWRLLDGFHTVVQLPSHQWMRVVLLCVLLCQLGVEFSTHYVWRQLKKKYGIIVIEISSVFGYWNFNKSYSQGYWNFNKSYSQGC